MSLTDSTMMPLGKKAPDFSLPDTVSGQTVSFNDVAGEQGTVVMFICNHCPYVLHIIDEIVAVATHYQPQGIGFVLAVEASVLGLAYPAFDAQKSPRAIAAAANRWAVPDSRIGLFHERALLGGLLYYGRFYGDRPIETLSDPREVSEFLRAGHVVVVSERDRSSLGALPIRETLRRGRRAIHVVRIAHGDDATRREPRSTKRNLSGESVFR